MKNAPNAEVLHKLTKARALMLIEQPFFGVLALRLHLAEDNNIPTLAVDGHTIRYNAQFIDDLPPEQIRTAVAHEVGHCVFSHIGRRGSRNPKKWNYAGDFVINGFLAFGKLLPGRANVDHRSRRRGRQQLGLERAHILRRARRTEG